MFVTSILVKYVAPHYGFERTFLASYTNCSENGQENTINFPSRTNHYHMSDAALFRNSSMFIANCTWKAVW